MTNRGPRHIVIAGASLAGVATANALRRRGYTGALTIVGAEAHLPYQRPPLSKRFLAGEVDRTALGLRLPGSLDAGFRLSTTALRLDIARHRLTVRDAGGGITDLGYDALVIATGAAPRLLPGRMPAGVHALRTVDDCVAIGAAIAGRPRIVVVGAGFIGCEVAATCRRLGLDVSLVDPLPAPMFRVLGERLGTVMAELHADHGVDVRMGRGVLGFDDAGTVTGVRLDDGSRIAGDLVILGLGVVPATGWLAGSGLILDDGVMCDEYGRALYAGGALPDIVAVGDVARWRHPRYGSLRAEHWDHALVQARAAAATLIDPGSATPVDDIPYFWSDQYDVKLQMVGVARAGDDVRIIDGDPSRHAFVAAYGRDERTTAVLLVNQAHRMAEWRSLLADGTGWPTTATRPPDTRSTPRSSAR